MLCVFIGLSPFIVISPLCQMWVGEDVLPIFRLQFWSADKLLCHIEPFQFHQVPLFIADLIAWAIRVLPIRTVMCLLWPCTQGHCPLSLLSGPVCLVLSGLLFLFRIKNIDLFAHSSACRAFYSLTSTTCWRCCGVFGMFCLFLFLFLLAFLYVSWFLSNHQVCVCHRNYICV